MVQFIRERLYRDHKGSTDNGLDEASEQVKLSAICEEVRKSHELLRLLTTYYASLKLEII